jgi:hypothetical protein
MLSICSIFTIVLVVVGVIGGDYSKLRGGSLLFFDGRVGGLAFFQFRFFGMAVAPTIITTSDHPLPPRQSYPQETVDSVDNFCKSLISLDFCKTLTEYLQNRFYTTSIMLTLNI